MGPVLALDLASRLGWALWQAPGRVASGSLKLPGRGLGHDLCAYRDWLDAQLSATKCWGVVFEAPWIGPQTSQDTARKLMGLACVTEMVATDRQVTRIAEANNATVRKHFIGRGHGPRDELKALTVRICKAMGWAVRDDNEADALAVLHWCLHVWKVPHGLPATAMFTRAA